MKTLTLLLIGIAASHGPLAGAQPLPARSVLESAAEAMGGLDRLRGLDNFVMTGFGQTLSQQGGGNLSPDPRAPAKWQAEHALERTFDLEGRRALEVYHGMPMFPFAISSSGETRRVQTGTATLDHPVTALLAALDADTTLGPVTSEDGVLAVEFTLGERDPGGTVWLGIDPATRLPAWFRWISGSTTLGDVTNTVYFTGYLPFDGIQLPVGFSHGIDWRDTTVAFLNIDSYRLDVPRLPRFPGSAAPAGAEDGPTAGGAEATLIADGVWDVRIGGNGGAVVEFDDHLTMFEAYGSEAATFARLDLANTLVPGKHVTEVIVSHHHFDHSGGLRAAVSRGLTIISRRGNEPIFREMVARPAPNFPDALARNPRPLEFVPVDEHLVLEDGSMRVDVYHAVGHLHMAEAVFAYVPRHRIFLEGDFTTFDWEWHWWGDAYLDSVERYGLDPAINIPVHGIVTTFDETIATIQRQVEAARAYCAQRAAVEDYPAGCPVKYSRD